MNLGIFVYTTTLGNFELDDSSLGYPENRLQIRVLAHPFKSCQLFLFIQEKNHSNVNVKQKYWKFCFDLISETPEVKDRAHNINQVMWVGSQEK